LISGTYKKYYAAIKNYEGEPMAPELLMAQEGAISVYYAPFEWVNPEARVVLVGITPGKTQAANALTEAKRAIEQNLADEDVLKRAKATGAFSGAMRPNLISMMDAVGLNTWLGLTSCSTLFGANSRMMQTASVLQFPVFLSGENYNGTPDMTKHTLLRTMLLEHFGAQCSRLPNAVFVPLGPVPTKAMAWLAAQGVVSSNRILEGLPHPSGANAERIKYFLGQKERCALSKKTDPDKLDAARTQLRIAVETLPRMSS